MKHSNNGFDEMQRDRKNVIGNQTFIFMFCLLMLEVALNSAGVKWLAYPANIMVIIMICMGVYLVRIIAANAYLPPRANNLKTIIILVCAISISWAIIELISTGKLSLPLVANESNDNSAIILFTVSVVGLVIAGIVAMIKRTNDKKDTGSE